MLIDEDVVVETKTVYYNAFGEDILIQTFSVEVEHKDYAYGQTIELKSQENDGTIIVPSNLSDTDVTLYTDNRCIPQEGLWNDYRTIPQQLKESIYIRVFAHAKDLIENGMGLASKSQLVKLKQMPEWPWNHCYRKVQYKNSSAKRTTFINIDLIPMFILSIHPKHLTVGVSDEVAQHRVNKILLLRAHYRELLVPSTANRSIRIFGTDMSNKFGEGKPIELLDGFVSNKTE